MGIKSKNAVLLKVQKIWFWVNGIKQDVLCSCWEVKRLLEGERWGSQSVAF